jgi:DNA-directed RNA polymerase subunit RPC12/RpoP
MLSALQQTGWNGDRGPGHDGGQRMDPNTLKCPSQEKTTKAVPQDYECPACGGAVEIWSDETKSRCPACGHQVLRAEAKLKQ